eukprot:208170-Chlamydomonas_euryale.AAC.5
MATAGDAPALGAEAAKLRKKIAKLEGGGADGEERLQKLRKKLKKAEKAAEAAAAAKDGAGIGGGGSGKRPAGERATPPCTQNCGRGALRVPARCEGQGAGRGRKGQAAWGRPCEAGTGRCTLWRMCRCMACSTLVHGAWHAGALHMALSSWPTSYRRKVWRAA